MREREREREKEQDLKRSTKPAPWIIIDGRMRIDGRKSVAAKPTKNKAEARVFLG